MSGEVINKDHKKRITKVVNFLLKNVSEEHSLEKLAALAHYSHFHFQRVFKQITGETPKQYTTRVRLENACHSVFVHQHKPISTIAAEQGFSSPAVFARAFKAHFGVTAEEFRRSGVARKNVHQQIEDRHQHQPEATMLDGQYDKTYWSDNLVVDVVRLPQRKVLSVSAPLTDAARIKEAYQRVVQLAGVYDLLATEPQLVGNVNPHQGTYWASVVITTSKTLPDDLNTFNLEAGKYATYKLKGDTAKTFHSLHAFYELWLMQSGYQIKDLFGMELFTQNPASTAYEK